jgi:hypothetical protein
MDLRIERVDELLPTLVRKDAMTDKGRDFRCTMLQQCVSTFNQCTTRLNEIIDNDAMKTFGTT